MTARKAVYIGLRRITKTAMTSFKYITEQPQKVDIPIMKELTMFDYKEAIERLTMLARRMGDDYPLPPDSEMPVYLIPMFHDDLFVLLDPAVKNPAAGFEGGTSLSYDLSGDSRYVRFGRSSAAGVVDITITDNDDIEEIISRLRHIHAKKDIEEIIGMAGMKLRYDDFNNSACPQGEDPGIRIFCHAAYSLDGKPIPLPPGADIDDVNECISDAIEEALWDM